MGHQGWKPIPWPVAVAYEPETGGTSGALKPWRSATRPLGGRAAAATDTRLQ